MTTYVVLRRKRAYGWTVWRVVPGSLAVVVSHHATKREADAHARSLKGEL